MSLISFNKFELIAIMETKMKWRDKAFQYFMVEKKNYKR